MKAVPVNTVWYSTDGTTWGTTAPKVDGTADVTTKDGTCALWKETTITVKAKPTAPTEPAKTKPTALPKEWKETKAAPAKTETKTTTTTTDAKKTDAKTTTDTKKTTTTTTDATKKATDAAKTDAKAPEVKDGPGACVADTECDKEVGGAKVTCGAAQLAAGVLSAIAVAASL